MRFKHPPLAHQLKEHETSKNMNVRALFWEMGTGKSKVMADTAAHLFLTGQIDVVLVLAKKGEYTNWKYVELPEHMSPDVEYVCEVYRSGLRSAEKQAVRDLCQPSTKLRVLCVNVESMSFDNKTKKMTTEGGKVAAAFLSSRKVGAMIIGDESTWGKNHKSKRSMAAYYLRDKARFRRILSGTPITRDPVDLWGQALMLSTEGLLGHRTLTSFKGEFVEHREVRYGQKTFKAVEGYKNLDSLNKRVLSFGSVLERKDCLDLPDKVYVKVDVPLTDRQQELYESMRDMAVAELKDDVIVEATNALGVISRLDQIACGQLRRDDGTFEIVESHRPEALMERLQVTRKRGIVWCNYRGLLEHLYDTLCREFDSAKVGRFYGGVPDHEREETVKRFQDPESDIMWIVANQASMGYGRTLTRGKENYYFSNGYNLEHRLQSEDRTMRLGQDESVLYTDFFTRGTVNDKIFVNLRGKRSLASQVLGTRITDWI